MKKFNWNTFFHIMGALGAILGIIFNFQKGWAEWQWPCISLLWILSSYVNLKTSEKLETIHTNMINDIKKINEELHEAQMKNFKHEFELAKNKTK